MKKFIMVVVCCVVGLFGQISSSNAAEVTCDGMTLTYIADGGVWAQNVTGGACAGIANGSSQYFSFSPAVIDRLLAISLTAMSLEKNVYLHALGDTVGSITDVIAISK